ncbi:MAG: LysR family transcriptional regulator [Candidatus Thiothrix singaporensis]|uniref:LysR family transcriptional regulator n=1 Tax=Candidatus Thiothrix singaporensis TaxID=2799669 RepID=A0A7L6ANX0_9GAMM|nr:MAG: LysR family transcriptional regulator [Candidatus Thiothrix singaporensis]
MNLHQLSLFAQVVKEGGFTAAAQVLKLPKSAVSAGVARLEADLGVKLLRRNNRHVSLTDEGAALYAHAAPALEALRESEAAVTEMRGALKGRIRITAPVGLGMQVLQPVVSRFLAQHPDTNVEAVFTMRVVDLVGEGFDLALRGGPLEDEDLIARQIGVGDASLFAAPSYLAQQGMPLSVADLAGRDFVLLKGCLHKHDEIYLTE